MAIEREEIENIIKGIKDYFDAKLNPLEEGLRNLLASDRDTNKEIHSIKENQLKMETRMVVVENKLGDHCDKIEKLQEFREGFLQFRAEILNILKKKKITPALLLSTLCASPIILLIFQALFKKLGW